jgi:hypothetical protein
LPARLDGDRHRSYHPLMPQWRCPHCATPQPVAARCWVCHRSSTSCATCRNFRVSVAANVGYCGLDRGRRPLSGDEIRACWDEAPTISLDPADAAPPAGSIGLAITAEPGAGLWPDTD